LSAALALVALYLATAMASPAQVQVAPQWELYGGTSFLWAKTSPQLAPFHLDTLNEW